MRSVSLTDALAGLGPKARFQRYRELWAEAKAYRVLTDFPMHLDIELSGLCNLKCRHCFQNGLIEKPLGLMDMALFEKLMAQGQAGGLCAVKLQVRGESFLHPKLAACIALAKTAGVMDVQITTNATLLNDETSSDVIESGLDGIIFSLDSQHGESFLSRRAGLAYEAVEAGIARFLELRAESGKKSPWVRLQVAVPALSQELLAAMKQDLAARFPLADVIVLNRIQDFREDVAVYPDLTTHYRMHPCDYLMHRLAVYWNGETTLCCMDYNNRLGLGNAHDDYLRDIWLSERLAGFRETHAGGLRKTMAPCRYCHACTSPREGLAVADPTRRHALDRETEAMCPEQETQP